MRFFLLGIFLIITFKSYAVEIIEKNYPVISGAQVFVIPPEYRDDLDNYFNEFKSHGINTVFLRVFHNKGDRAHLLEEDKCERGGVYFKTDRSCVVFDLLKDATEAANRQGIKLFAWMATRSLVFLKDISTTSSFTPDGFVEGYGANIFSNDVRHRVIELFKDLADYNIDGILIQDDFIIKYSEGADRLSCDAFYQKTGLICSMESFFDGYYDYNGRKILKTGNENFIQWSLWKAEELTILFSEIKYNTRIINPKLKWAANIYYETPVSPSKGLAWYAQSMEKLLDAGIDYLSVMLYSEQIMNEMSFSHNQFLNFASELSKKTLDSVDSKRTIFKLQSNSFLNKKKIASKDIIKLCEILIKNGGRNFILLPVYQPSDIATMCSIY